MPNIKYNQIQIYNALVADNKGLMRELAKSHQFPWAKLHVNITPLNSESNDYQRLSDWAGGDENAWYLIENMHAFNKDWIVYPKDIIKRSELPLGTNKGKFILDISDCFEQETINIYPLEFFENSLKKRYFTGNLRQLQQKGNIGDIEIPASKIGIKNKEVLYLSLLNNYMCFAKRP